jgi:hypothetical protein
MSTGKANGGERAAALAGRVMECMDNRAGRGRSRGATDCDSDDAPGRGRVHVVKQEVLLRSAKAAWRSPSA